MRDLAVLLFVAAVFGAILWQPILVKFFPDVVKDINDGRDARVVRQTAHMLNVAFKDGRFYDRDLVRMYIRCHLPKLIELESIPEGLHPDEHDCRAYDLQAEERQRIERMVAAAWENNRRNPYLHPPVAPRNPRG